jgi:nucleotide-binding universal stress UspA family protein
VKRIVIATDGSEGSRRAVEAGVELARLSGAVVTFAYVRHGVLLLLGDPFYSRRLAADLEQARATVDDAVSCAAEAGVESESEILEGDAAEQILELGRLRDADLIVVAFVTPT